MGVKNFIRGQHKEGQNRVGGDATDPRRILVYIKTHESDYYY